MTQLIIVLNPDAVVSCFHVMCDDSLSILFIFGCYLTICYSSCHSEISILSTLLAYDDLVMTCLVTIGRGKNKLNWCSLCLQSLLYEIITSICSASSDSASSSSAPPIIATPKSVDALLSEIGPVASFAVQFYFLLFLGWLVALCIF